MKRSQNLNAYNFLKGQYLSQSEVSEVLGLSEWTVRRRADEGQLVRKYDGRTPRYCAYSVQAYMNRYSFNPGVPR